MAITDFLEKVGKGAEKGLQAAGSFAAPVLERTAQVVSGEAPKLDEEKRQREYAQEDALINAQAKELENQLAIGEKYGTLTPQDRQQYVDAIAGLYKHPRHAGTLMEKMRQAVYPQGATYTPGSLSTLKNATPQGGTLAADEASQLTSLKHKTEQQSQLDREAMVGDVAFIKQNLTTMGIPVEKQQKFIEEYIGHRTGVMTGKEGSPALDIKGGIMVGAKDADGTYYTADRLAPGGDAPETLKAQANAYTSGEEKKKTEADEKWKKQQEAIDKRHQETLQMESDRMLSMFRNQMFMDQFKDAQKQLSAHETTYNAAIDLQKKMQNLLPSGLAGDQQAQLGILANHIAMTTHQPGASMRPTKALFDEAATSQPWLDSITKRFDNNGVLVGVVLSPQQMQQMVDMAQTSVDAERETLQEMKQDYQKELNPSPEAPREKRVAKVLTPPGGVNKANVNQVSGKVKMRAPDGTVSDVDRKDVEHYKSRGATVVQ